MPFIVYSGWITVASIVNVATVLVKYNWIGFGWSPEFWAIAMIVIATVVNLAVTWTRNLKGFAFVGAWALLAIYVANKDTFNIVAYTALIASSLLVCSNLVKMFFNSKLRN